MRTNTIPAALAALFLFAGCDPETAPLPEAEDRREEVAADGAQPAKPAPSLPPGILAASDSATNYAPPGWPLSPGDTVTRRERVRLNSEWGDNFWGTAVVWVAGEGGPERSLPFGAGFTRPRRDEPMIYVGHVPMRPVQWTAEQLEEDLPACLRGVVDPRDHIQTEAEWEAHWARGARWRSIGSLAALEEVRKPYYGPEAVSW